MPDSNLRKRREELGLNQEDIAKELGVAKSTVSRWERGAMRIKQDNLPLLSNILQTTSSYILGETDDPSINSMIAKAMNERLHMHLREGIFSSLLEVSGFLESIDDDANVTIYNDEYRINKTPELEEKLTNQVISYFKYLLIQEADRR